VETRFKLFGHPVHPFLVVFPLGLLSTAVVFDLIYVFTSGTEFAVFSYWAMAAGLLGAAVAAGFGLLDYLGIPRDTRAKRVATMHGLGMLTVFLLFGVSFLTRISSPTYLPSVIPLVFSLAGAAVALVAAWLGGELVYRLRVAVDDDASLNASNSLSSSGVADVKP
jgi:uncharacterized membrane protein